MHSTTREPSPTREPHTSRAKHDMHSVMDDVVDNVEESIIDTARSAGETVRDVVDNATDTIQRTTKKISHEVHDNPVQSSLIALGVGFVVGMMIRR